MASDRFLSALLLALLLALGAGPSEAREDDRNLEPIPPMIVFPSREGRRPDLAGPHEALRKEIARSSASLGDIQAARRLIVHRFGLISVPELETVLAANNVTPHWNALLTIGALRDVYGPALELNRVLPALARKLTPQPGDFHTPAFAALAIGCFHWPQTLLPSRYAHTEGRYEAVPGPRRSIEKAIRALTEARASILRRVSEPQNFLRVAALLALGKMGGPKARQGVTGLKPPEFYPTEQHQAELVVRALLEVDDPKPYLRAMRDVERRVRAAGALAVSVGLLTESPATWTRDTDAILKLLKNEAVMTQEAEEAEATFARGLLALRDGSSAEWDTLWSLARTHSTKYRVAEAAAQALLFLDTPEFKAQIVEWAGNARVILKDPVLGMLLLRAGEMGTADALAACEKWLRRSDKRPSPDDRWDPRWYAAIGLLRAVHAGRIKSRSLRARVIDTLERAVTKVFNKKARFRAALRVLLDQHGQQIMGADPKSLYRLPATDLRRLEQSFRCPCGLLARDPADACVRRVNDMVALMFGLDGIRPAKPGEPVNDKQPERYLRRYLDDFPYFSRLDFLDDRGARRPRPVTQPDPKVIDR